MQTYTVRVTRNAFECVDIKVRADSGRDARMIAFALDGGMGKDYPKDYPSKLVNGAISSWTEIIA
jgi:hypothetical protein